MEENHSGFLGRISALCRRDAPIVTRREVIGWWEARRIPFNLIVGSVGILTCVVIGIVGLASEAFFNSEFGFPDPPIFAIFGIIIYAIFANVCFTGGWIAELLVRKLWPREADRFATLSFSFGIVFSILLTLSPAFLVGALGLLKLLKRL